MNSAQRRVHPLGWHEIAEARRIRVPLAGELVRHHTLGTRAAPVVVGVVVAAPQPTIEGDLRALEPPRPPGRRLVVAKPQRHRLCSERRGEPE